MEHDVESVSCQEMVLQKAVHQMNVIHLMGCGVLVSW